MSTPYPRPTSRPPDTGVRRRAPLKSVSTRIVLCVFASTLLTALIVSWLCVGAIHQDVRSRVSQRAGGLLQDRVTVLERWHREVTDRLLEASASGTAWHASLVRALDEHGEASGLDWNPGSDRDPESADTSSTEGLLRTPPGELAVELARLRLHPPTRLDPSSPVPLDCLAVAADLVGSSGSLVGRLEGCLDEERLLERLQPPPAPDLEGFRLLLVDATGRVAIGAGVRAARRVGAELPIVELRPRGEDRLRDYTDGTGLRLVGRISPIGATGWLLVAESEYAHAFAPAIAVTNQIFVVDVCIILLFSVLAYKITIAIMQPIEALSEGAQRIAAGQIDHQIPMPARGDDELGLLTRTFNEMMRKLRSNQLEIEEDRIRLAEKNEELQRANEILAQLSITDGLTKLHNHRYFQDHLTREIKRVSRTHAPLALILLDIDDFKQLNDVHGHAAGDEVLIALAAIMNDSARESDLIARYGGEEFVILLPNTDLAGAVHLAEKLRMAVESTRLIIGDSMKPIEITISLGVSVYHGDRKGFFAAADRALYQAKASGKNCVIIAGSDPATPNPDPRSRDANRTPESDA